MSGATVRSDRPRATKQPALHLLREQQPAVEWPEYPRLEPKEYLAYCRKAIWYRDPGFHRWTCMLLFDVLTQNQETTLARIPMWFNGGDRDKPRAGMRSTFLPAWVAANGGPPVRRDRLSLKVFERRMARVLVGDTTGPIPYSVVRKILEWSTGSSSQSVTQSS